MANVARGAQLPVEQPMPEETGRKGRRKKDKAAQPKEKKRMTPLRAALIVAIAFLLILTVLFALVLFNVGNSRVIALSFLQMGEHPYQNQMDELTALQETLRAQSVAISEAQQELDARESELSKRERDVASRESATTTRAEDLDAKEQLLYDTSVELARLVGIYEKLTPATAAKILQEMKDIDEVTRILNEMKPALVSDILTSMDVEFAAKVSFAMLGDTP